MVPTTITAGKPKLYKPAVTGGVPLNPKTPASIPDKNPKKDAKILLDPVSLNVS